MPRPKSSVPHLRRHASPDRGYVYVDGKRRYLGPWDDPTTLERDHRFCAELVARTPMDGPGLLRPGDVAAGGVTALREGRRARLPPPSD